MNLENAILGSLFAQLTGLQRVMNMLADLPKTVRACSATRSAGPRRTPSQDLDNGIFLNRNLLVKFCGPHGWDMC
ncbi:hypothetical protein APED_21390 [Acanthopleuribacter pedis]